jgi:hypothetical protein
MIILIILFIIFITVITGRLLLHNSTFGSFNKTLSIKFSISYFIGSSFYIITLTSYFFIFKNLELSNLFTILSALLLFFKRRKELLKIFFENFNLNYKIIFYNILIFVFLSIFIFSVWAIPYENLDNKLLSIGSLHSAKYAWLANYIQTCSIIPVTGNNFGQSILAYFIGLFFSAKPHLYLYIWLVISMYFLILFIYGFINFYFGAVEGKKNIQIYCVLGTVCFLFGGTALSFTHILVIDSNNPFIINGYTHTIFGIFFIFFGYILFIKIKEGKNLNLQNIFIIFIFLGANYFMSPENIIFFAGLLFFVFFTKSIMRNQKIKLAILLIISIIYFIPQGGMLTPIKLQENFSNEAILSFFQDRRSNQYGKLNLSIVPGYMFQYDGLSYSKWKNGQEENTKKLQYLKEKIKKDFFSNFNILLWQLEKILIDSFVVLFFPIAGLYLFRQSFYINSKNQREKFIDRIKRQYFFFYSVFALLFGISFNLIFGVNSYKWEFTRFMVPFIALGLLQFYISIWKLYAKNLIFFCVLISFILCGPILSQLIRSKENLQNLDTNKLNLFFSNHPKINPESCYYRK